MNNDKTFMCPDWYQPLLMPITETLPCGENLEEDPAFLILENRIQPRMGAEYGDFVETVDPVNWAEIEREVKTLLTRTLDLRLILILIRCRFRRIGIPALEEGLCALIWALQQWPEHIHPQLYDEGEFEPILRANVLTELESPDGILNDLRSQPLPKVAGLQLNVRDVERAVLMPQSDQALDENTLSLALLGWQEQQAKAILSLRHAEQRLNQLRSLLTETLRDNTPDFNRLFKLLSLFHSVKSLTTIVADDVAPTEDVIETANIAPTDTCLAEPQQAQKQTVLTTTPLSTGMMQVAPAQGIQDRTDALLRLREIQQWFVRHEPSSPVGDLLTLTEQIVGKRFTELLQILPQDLLTRLSNGQET